MRSRPLGLLTCLLVLAGCGLPEEPPPPGDGIGSARSLLSASERRTRAGQIRDAAFANGITEGYLLAGIADAETNMSHCWSELTWACMGPSSPDCGGGPVVAGAGDGPCHLREGGLGMFQFDAGTFDDTLRREGDRVLRIAGNVAAAVDFVVNMVIRSTYVSGVDNRSQAIDWINGVRIDNGRWDAWIRTVTHYYNGCRPSYSCWSSRYAHYRDNTRGVHDEMGASFWDVDHDYAAEFVSQSFPLAREPFELVPGEEAPGEIVLRNTGNATWEPGATFLGTTEPRDGDSPLAGPGWVNPHRAATVGGPVPPGETGRFAFAVRAPDTPGEYPQYFTLVQEGVAWFSDQGGPPDDQLQVRVTVTDDPPAEPDCPEGTGAEWACDGDERVRCTGGMVEREACEDGCVTVGSGDDICATPAADGDGDGWSSARDCDDANAFVHPDADEVCADGVDQNCDGVDPPCGGGDGGVGDTDGGRHGFRGRGDTRSLQGGCSAAGGAAPEPWLPLLLILVLVIRRRP